MQAYKEYWMALKQSCLELGANDELKEMFAKFKPEFKPSDKNWRNVTIKDGDRNEHIVLRLRPSKNNCSAGLYFESYEDSKASIERFESRKDEIERAYSIKLSAGRTNTEKNPGKAYEISITGGLERFDERDCWSQAIDWMKQCCLILKEIYFQVTHESAIPVPDKTIMNEIRKPEKNV